MPRSPRASRALRRFLLLTSGPSTLLLPLRLRAKGLVCCASYPPHPQCTQSTRTRLCSSLVPQPFAHLMWLDSLVSLTSASGPQRTRCGHYFPGCREQDGRRAAGSIISVTRARVEERATLEATEHLLCSLHCPHGDPAAVIVLWVQTVWHLPSCLCHLGTCGHGFKGGEGVKGK